MDDTDKIVDGVQRAFAMVARAITADAQGTFDVTGTHVSSLTEAVMGMTSALGSIADAIDNLADAVREH